jgi:hypothetical protein
MAALGTRLLATAALALALGAVEARADLVFTLSGVTFNDGTLATGSFRTDTALINLLDWDITTNPGATPGFHFTTATAPVNFSAIPFILVVEDSAPHHILQLTFTGGLTAAGAAITPDPNSSFEEDNGVKRAVLQGVVVGQAAVPEPSSLALAGTAALAGLGLWARRRRAAPRVG